MSLMQCGRLTFRNDENFMAQGGRDIRRVDGESCFYLSGRRGDNQFRISGAVHCDMDLICRLWNDA